MKQTTKLELTLKHGLYPQLQNSLKLLSLPSGALAEHLNDLALSNPYVQIVTPTSTRNDAAPMYQAAANQTTSLDMHLLDQLKLSVFDDQQKRAILSIITTLDDHGFFTGNIEDIAKNTGLSENRAHELLNEIKTLDPPGIGARDYKESIEIQLRLKGQLTEDTVMIVRHHLDKLSKEDYAAITRQTGIHENTCKTLLMQIKKLNPYPARSFSSSDRTIYVQPDIIIDRSGDSLNVRLNERCQYQVRVSDDIGLQPGAALSASDKQYITNMRSEANWLKSALQKRYATLLRCAQHIAKAQRLFFHLGPPHIVPLQKKAVADALGMHPSTVGRTLSGKYILCDHGVFAADYFFCGHSCFSGKYSPAQIKNIIREMIDSENKRAPENDTRISAVLNASGIDISRRTVAKYRAALGISPASVRRKT